MERWKGKVAVVTGASAGIGAVIAEKLVCYGITVVGLARRIEKLEELAKKLKKRGNFFSYKTDVQNEEDVVGAFKWISEKFGQVHILINNAGVVKLAELTKCPSFELKESFNVNVFGLCFATREASKIMLDNKIDGHIIHISSIAGHNVLSAESGIYCASKHAVLVLAEALRKELTSKNSKIKISCISPGAVDTDMLLNAVHKKENYDAMPKLRSEDVADVVTYVLRTPPNVQIQEVIIKPVGEII